MESILRLTLPNAVMSHLNPLQMVQTCMLSTRWRHHWRAVPCLVVNEEATGAYNNFYKKKIDSAWQELCRFIKIEIEKYIE